MLYTKELVILWLHLAKCALKTYVVFYVLSTLA
jgi:hypothetical protein